MLESKNAIRAIIAFSALCLVIFVVYLFELSSRLDNLQQRWKQNNQLVIEETRSIGIVLGQLGYTGYIHNFKNFVLRRDPKYLSAMQDNVARFNVNLANLRNLLTDQASQEAIKALKQTIATYQQKASVLQENMEALPASELDSLVRVDDSKAAEALRLLIRNVEKANLVMTADNERKLQDTQKLLRYGNLMVVAFALLIGAVIAMLRKMQTSNESLQEAIERIDMLIDASPGALFIVNQQGLVTRVNKAAAAMFKATDAELVGKAVETFIPERWRKGHIAHRQRFQRSGKSIAMDSRNDLKAVRPDGKEIDVEISLNRTRINGEPAVLLNLRDVTEQRAVDKLAEHTTKLEALEQLTGGVAHDFNNILLAITGNSELIKMTLPKEYTGINGYLNSLNAAAARAAAINSRLMSFGRMQPLKLETFPLQGFFEEFTAALTLSLGDKVHLQLNCDESLWPIRTDREQLESALLNLCLNAKQAMPEGGNVIISVENVHMDRSFCDEFGQPIRGHFISVSVTDNGVGIPKGISKHVFEPFFTTRERSIGSGSGLGLSMVYGFIKQCSGHIKIFSEEGVGTAVKLLLPAALTSSVQESRSELPARDDPPVIDGKVILVIDDDAEVRAVPVQLLSDRGYQVLEAGSTESAMELANSVPEIDLIFSDIVLSAGKNGVDLVNDIRGLHPDAQVIFTTGYTDQDLIKNLVLDESQLLLTKPYSAQDLFRVVGSLTVETVS